MTPISDDRFEFEVVSFLRHHAEDLSGAADARAIPR